MSIITVKLTCFLAFTILGLLLFTEDCEAQSLELERGKLNKDTVTAQKDAVMKSGNSLWGRIKKDVKGRYNQEAKEGKKTVRIVSAPANKSSKKEKPNKDDERVAINLPKDTTKKIKDSLKSNVHQKLGHASAVISDTLNKDSLKERTSKIVSKENIKKVAGNQSFMDDYTSASESLTEKTKKLNKRERKKFVDSKKNVVSNRFENKIKNPLQNKIDTIKHIDIKEIAKKQLTNNIKGSISFGYEYGILPYVSPERNPLGAFKNEGRFSVSVLNLPVEVSYRYTTVKSTLGINNYFRVSYDVNRYKEDLEKKTAVREQLKKIKLDKMQLDRQELGRKMEYYKLLSNVNVGGFQLPDTTFSFDKKLISKYADSLNVDTSKARAYLQNNRYLQNRELLKKKDSLLKYTSECKERYDYYKTRYDSINKVIDKAKNAAEGFQDFNVQDQVKGNSYIGKIEGFLKNIKKFEIGLCNPSYSLFLVSNAPLKGINFEYATKENFFAITYGTTVNTLFYNPNTLQGKIQGARNFYNFFDFNQLANGRKILAVKGGKGQKDGTHFFVGVLLGKGKIDYLTVSDPKYGKKESNLVLEVDGKYKFNEVLSAELILGKSSLQAEDVSMEQIKKSFNEIFSSYRSNAFQARINYDVLKTKTKLQLTGRLIDPYFKSFGVSFLRSDNIRYEAKAEQVITKNIKYTVSFRREEDNLLGLINFKNTFTTVSNSLAVKLKKGISVRLNYSPLLRTIKNGNDRITDRNSISTAVVSYVPKMKDIQASYNLLYSKYRITSDSGNIHFDNVSYSHQFQFKNGFKTGMNASWFQNTLIDTLNNNTYLGVVDIGYTTEEQNSFTIGGKTAYKPGAKTEFGFLAKVTLKIYKTVFLETEAEKILIGDYYSSLIDAKIRQFPYYLSTKMIINF